MKKIGGFFPPEEILEKENHFLSSLVPEDGDYQLMMSGRCGNYYALQDICLSDTRRVAYVPAYTCETVLAPFEKAGFRMKFYQVEKDTLKPVFDSSVLDEISLISICGYYGFSKYDKAFIKECHDRGIIVLEDTTHSILSGDGIDPYCDYVVGSFRKWIGVPAGGFAIKMHGKFLLPVIEPNMIHLKMRSDSMTRKKMLDSSDPDNEKALNLATEVFWDAEMMLRQIFDSYGSDPVSTKIVLHTDFSSIKAKRRNNYQYLTEHFPSHPLLTVVYPELDEQTVPSHFSIYAKDREHVQHYLKEQGISTTAYWPKNEYVLGHTSEETDYIYDHILSIPCDQRYTPEDMAYICKVIQQLPEQF